MDDCYLPLLSRRWIPFSLRYSFAFTYSVVAKPHPRIDDNYKMYFIFPNHVLDIEVIVIPVHRIVTYGVQHIISSTYTHVQTRQPTRRGMPEVTALKIQDWGIELIDKRRRGFLLESSR